MIKEVTAKELEDAIDRGWDPVWFATEDEDGDGKDDTLTVDFCYHTRLQDCKMLFLKCTDYDAEFIQLLAEKMTQRWLEIIQENIARCEL